MISLSVRPFAAGDQAEVFSLWQRCGLLRPWNDPVEDVRLKALVQPELFLVGELDGRVIASAMAGYDGHRGSLFYLAVKPELQGRGYGRMLLSEVERRLLALGCPKLNLMVRGDNLQVLEFYQRLGYQPQGVVCLGKRLDSAAPLA